MNYTIQSVVYIRAGMKIVEQRDPRNPKKIITNIKGYYAAGKIVNILELQTDNDNNTWGRVSEPDPTGQANWIMVKGLNRTFAVRTPSETLEETDDASELQQTQSLVLLFKMVEELQSRVTDLENKEKQT